MFYTQIVFISCILEKIFYTHPVEDSYIVHDHIDISFFLLLLLQKDVYTTLEHIDAFCLFPLQKDFVIFHMLLFRVFLCVFDNIYLPISIYIKYRKKTKKMFYQFFICSNKLTLRYEFCK